MIVNGAQKEYPIGRILAEIEKRRVEVRSKIDAAGKKPEPLKGEAIMPSGNRKFLVALARGIAKMRFKRTNKPAIEIAQRAEDRVLIADRLAKQEIEETHRRAAQAAEDIKEVEMAAKIVEALQNQGRQRMTIAGELSWRSIVQSTAFASRGLVDQGPLPEWYPTKPEDLFPMITKVRSTGEFEGGLRVIVEKSAADFDDPAPSFLEIVVDSQDRGVMKMTFQNFSGCGPVAGDGTSLRLAMQRGKIGDFPCIFYRADPGVDIFAVHNLQ